MVIIRNDWDTHIRYYFFTEQCSCNVYINKYINIPILYSLYTQEDQRNKGFGVSFREEVEQIIMSDPNNQLQDSPFGEISVTRSKDSDQYYMSVGYKKEGNLLTKRIM